MTRTDRRCHLPAVLPTACLIVVLGLTGSVATAPGSGVPVPPSPDGPAPQNGCTWPLWDSIDLVVRGHVDSLWTEEIADRLPGTADRRAIYTIVSITVTEILAGLWDEPTLRFFVHGGRVGDRASDIAGLVDYIGQDEDGLFFLMCGRPSYIGQPRWLGGAPSNRFVSRGDSLYRLEARDGRARMAPDYTPDDLVARPCFPMRDMRDSIDAILAPRDPRQVWAEATLAIDGVVLSSERLEVQPDGSTIVAPEIYGVPADDFPDAFEKTVVKVTRSLKGTYGDSVCVITGPDRRHPGVARHAFHAAPRMHIGDHIVALLVPGSRLPGSWQLVNGRASLFHVYPDGTVAPLFVPVGEVAATLSRSSSPAPASPIVPPRRPTDR